MSDRSSEYRLCPGVGDYLATCDISVSRDPKNDPARLRNDHYDDRIPNHVGRSRPTPVHMYLTEYETI